MGKRETRKGYKQLNVEVPTLTKEKVLPAICEADKRSMAAEIEWLIERRAQEIKEGK
jgi:hypothetical protein